METLEPPLIDHFGAPWVAPDRYELRLDARRFETWENNYAARLGLGRSIDYALELGLENIEARCSALSTTLREELRTSPGVLVHDLGGNPASIVTFSVAKFAGADVKAKLAECGINVSVSAPSSTLLDARARQLPPVVRASPHYYNSEGEIERFIDTIRALTKN